MDLSAYRFSRSESFASYLVSIHSSKVASFFIFSREAAVFLIGWIVPGAGNTAAGTGHSFQKIAVIFSGFCDLEHFLQLVRPSALTTLTSRDGSRRWTAFTTAAATPPLAAKPRPSALARTERFALRERSKVNIFCFKHAGNFLKRQDKIDIAADRAAAGLQFFRRAWGRQIRSCSPVLSA